MPDVVRSLLGSPATPIGHPRVISGYISKSRPAPASFTDPVYVIAEDHSEDRPYGPMAWPAIHGATMPAQGSACVFVMDQNNTPTLVSWKGEMSPTPSISPLIAVNRQPSGPSAPTGGWACVMAEGFNPDYPLGRPYSIFAPNRNNNAGDDGMVANCTPFNGDNELEVFNASQVTFANDGVHLTARYVGPHAYGYNTNGDGINYVSACLSSQPVDPTGGQAGFPITGFGYKQLPSSVLALEVVLTLPTYVGADMGWWAQGPGTGANEQDFVEWTNYVNPGPGQAAGSAWINHLASTSQGDAAYNVTEQTDGKTHRWTTLIDGNLLTVTTYLDGAQIMSYPWLGTWPDNYCNLILSHALRNPQYPPPTGQSATFTGTEDCVVRSVACYQDAPHAGEGTIGGGVALGTVLV